MNSYKVSYRIVKTTEVHNVVLDNEEYTDELDTGHWMYSEVETFIRDFLAHDIKSKFKEFVPLSSRDIEINVVNAEHMSVSVWMDDDGDVNDLGKCFVTYDMYLRVEVIPDVSPLERLNLATAKSFYNEEAQS